MNLSAFTDKEINTAIMRYTYTRNYQKEYKKNKYNTDEDYKKKIMEKSKNYYENNKDKKKDYYQKNKELIGAKRKFNYYKKLNKMDVYIEKYPTEYNKYFID